MNFGYRIIIKDLRSFYRIILSREHLQDFIPQVFPHFFQFNIKGIYQYIVIREIGSSLAENLAIQRVFINPYIQNNFTLFWSHKFLFLVASNKKK